MNPAEVQLKMASFWLHICAVRHHHWPEHQSLVAGLVAMLSLHGPGCRVRGICATHCSCPQTWALASPQPTAWADTGTRVIRSGSVWIQSLTAATRHQTAELRRAAACRYLDNFLWLWVRLVCHSTYPIYYCQWSLPNVNKRLLDNMYCLKKVSKPLLTSHMQFMHLKYIWCWEEGSSNGMSNKIVVMVHKVL